MTIYKDGSFDISKLYKQTQLDGILEQYMKKQNSKGKLYPFKLKKDFNESKDRELKDTETKIRKEIEELFLKPINTSTNYMDKFVGKEMIKKRSLAKNTWYDWLLSYIPRLIRKWWNVLKARLSL